MPRRGRCVLPEMACHVTQRGVDRRETFSVAEDRETYLRLLQSNLRDADVRVLAWCLMCNHVHLVAVPAREDSLSVLFRRVHGRYAQYYNARWGRTGHLWQNRYFSCVLGASHLWAALAYVERNPVRAEMVGEASEYPCNYRRGFDDQKGGSPISPDPRQPDPQVSVGGRNAKSAAALGALQDQKLMPQGQDFSMQGGTSSKKTSQSKQEREECVEHGVSSLLPTTFQVQVFQRGRSFW